MARIDRLHKLLDDIARHVNCLKVLRNCSLHNPFAQHCGELVKSLSRTRVSLDIYLNWLNGKRNYLADTEVPPVPGQTNRDSTRGNEPPPLPAE